MHYRFVLRVTWGLICVASAGTSWLHAQYTTGLQLFPSAPNAAFDQPAWLGQEGSIQYSVSGIGGYGLASNAFSMDDLLLGDGLIDEADKNRIINEASDPYRLTLNTGAGGLVMFRLKNDQPISLSYQYNIAAGASIPGQETIQLLLNGNTPYLGQTLSDEDIRFSTHTYQAIGLGSAWKVDKLSVGVRLKALLGNQLTALDPFSYQLSSDSLGSELSLSGQYLLDEKDDLSQLDLGVGLDVGVSWQLNQSWLVHASATDLGWIGWRVRRMEQARFGLDYRGVEVSDLVNIDQAFSVDIVDSVTDLLFPDTVQTTAWRSVGGRIAVGANWDIKDGHKAGIQVLYHALYTHPAHALPSVHLAYRYLPTTWLSVGLNAHVGGVDRWGAGLFAQGRLKIGESNYLRIFYQADNLMGYLLTDSGSGIAMQGGVSFALGKK